MYQIGLAAPWWKPEHEVSGFTLLAVVQVHHVYEQLRAERENERIKGMFGG